MAAKEISKFFFFAAPSFSMRFRSGVNPRTGTFRAKERKIQNEKDKTNPDKNQLRKLRKERNKLKKNMIEYWTYCPFDLYLAINKSSLPTIPKALDKGNLALPNILRYYDEDLEVKKTKELEEIGIFDIRVPLRERDYEYRTWKSEGKEFLISVDKANWKLICRPIDVLNKLENGTESREYKAILSAIKKGINLLDRPNIFKIELTNTEKRNYLYFLGKDCLGMSEKRVISRMNEEFSFWPIFLGSNIGFEKNILLGENRTGHGFYHIHEQRVWLTDSEDFENTPKQEENLNKRARIPDDVQIFVWNRDGGACVKCGSKQNLAFDHIIPHSLGGSDTRRNLQILCDECNQRKGNKIGG